MFGFTQVRSLSVCPVAIQSSSRSPTFSAMSHSYSQASHHSRGARPRAGSGMSVTEASFQNLGLHETAGTHRSISSYRPQDQRSPRSSYCRGDLPSNYPPTGYETSTLAPASASETYIDPQRLSSNYIPSATDPSDYLNPQSATHARLDMG